MLTLRDIEVRRGERVTLALDELHLEGDRFTVILGHNGSGKSTLMNLLARQLEPTRGSLQLDGRTLAGFSARDFARRVAFLPQHLPDVAGLTVRELVRLGRFPWRGLLGRWRAEDHAAVDQALAQTDVTHYADHLADSLSGGERQRVLLAQGLVPEAQLLVLDEPMSALDEPGVQVFEQLLRDWRQAGTTVLWIEHDLQAVGRLADRVTGLNRRVLFDDTPQQVLTPERLLELFSSHPRQQEASS